MHFVREFGGYKPRGLRTGTFNREDFCLEQFYVIRKFITTLNDIFISIPKRVDIHFYQTEGFLNFWDEWGKFRH